MVEITQKEIYSELKRTHDDVIILQGKMKSYWVAVKWLFAFDMVLLSSIIALAFK